ncbi:FtsK/SpoIIIE domain-containing protein [Nonomuraea maritima]|uniref:FtsK/SpoIIIE domain-containing protein n=1 Tax=Nonomuraea maritima TaxID=683260 RepID=UPI00370FAC03
MSPDELLGKVTALYLKDELAGRGASVAEVRPASTTNDAAPRADADNGGGTARFIIDRLTKQQTAAIARAVMGDPELSERVDIKLPESFVGGLALPAKVLTDKRATYLRNAPCRKPALLLANTGDDEDQSLHELTPVGSPDLIARPGLWVQVASAGVPVTEDEKRWWEKALGGLSTLHAVSLDRFAAYVLRTRALIDVDGHPLHDALDSALPSLGWPKNSGEFSRIAPRFRGQTAKWKALYATVQSKRACFLSKQTPSGTVLTSHDLNTVFKRVEEDIPKRHHQTVRAFIDAPGGWTEASAALAECDWEDIKPLFDGFHRKRFNLGAETLRFYDENDPDLLSDGDRAYLERLSARPTTGAALDDDREFYDTHRDELRGERRLRAAWDRFIFGTPAETYDFVAGLIACMERLSWDTSSSRRTLTITSDRRSVRDLRELNEEAGLYFARRYAGLSDLFGSSVRWEMDRLLTFPTLAETWRASKDPKSKPSDSEARTALQIKFTVTLESESVRGIIEPSSVQFIWRYDPKWITSGLVRDWDRLAKCPLAICRANRERTSSKGAVQSVDLRDVRTLMAAYGRERGSLVRVVREANGNDLGRIWRNNLRKAQEIHLISAPSADHLANLFDEFEQRYSQAVKDFVTVGTASQELEPQAIAYGNLLDAVHNESAADRTRQMLLKPLLDIGTVAIDGGQPTAIIAPWHPLRMAAMGRKAHRASDLVRQLLETTYIEFGDSDLFFRELREEFAHPFYPEVAIGWHSTQPELLALTDTVGDYTLHESPFAVDTGADDTNENPAESASRVTEIVRRYLTLHPHERANLSVVLYDCDSSRLPLAVVDKLAALDQEEEDVRCHVMLRHRDLSKLSWLYEQIVDTPDSDGDGYVAGEATRDFMARLRIGISADPSPPPDPRDGCPHDIVFSQDVIARRARLEWYPEDTRPVPPEMLNPAQWSRRRPVAMGDMKSVVYLTCPVQRAEGWSYLGAISSFFQPGSGPGPDRGLLPARQLDFGDATTARIFDETHNLATWVANYDELLDRRQLREQGVRIIRYKQLATQGRSLIISSAAPMGLLRSMIISRLSDLRLGLQDAELRQLADRFINDANEVSGDIVLRAARRGTSASELIGVVLSRHIVRHEIGASQLAGWYFLDDYVDWLGQREQRIADLLALSPRVRPDGSMTLLAVLTEAKYIDGSNLATKRRESAKQLLDTLRRMAGGVIGTPPRLDRTVWLARLSDLLVDGITTPAGMPHTLPDWRRAVREGQCSIELRGYSHVFVPGPIDTADCSVRTRLADPGREPFGAFQEIFGRDHVRELVISYYRGTNPAEVRQRLNGGEAGGSPSSSYPGTPPEPPGPIGEEPIGADDMESTGEPYSQLGRSAQTAAEPDIGQASAESSKSGAPSGASILQPTREPGADIGETSPQASPADSDCQQWPYPEVSQWMSAETSGSSKESVGDGEWLLETEATAKEALRQFQLQAKLLRSVLTPNAAMLKFRGSASLTVDQVQRRRVEFLTTYGLNLIGVQPEPGVVSLSIARPRRDVVPLPSLWQRWVPEGQDGNQSMLIGVREDDGDLLVLSPSRLHAPHTLIAGSTGSGKSVLMQNIILSIAATNRPDQARIILIDPKQGVDYFAFEDLPHLQGGIIDQQDHALTQIGQLVEEMDTRYVRMRQARAVNVHQYNAQALPADRMPTLWLIHDEFAEWMLTEEYKKEVASAVQRLGVKARAAGIYLVFAAQRPEANVMPMQLRANLGNRLILRVDSEGTSEIALGDKGAERLLGKGHLLAKLEGSPSPIYAQVPYAASDEISEVVEIIKRGTASAESR